MFSSFPVLGCTGLLRQTPFVKVGSGLHFEMTAALARQAENPEIRAHLTVLAQHGGRARGAKLDERRKLAFVLVNFWFRGTAEMA